MSIKIDKSLINNTFFLYLLTFSNQLLSLITVPYLTRVLGVVTYGKMGVALAYMSYVSILMDFGFLQSATQKVVENKNNKSYIGELLFAVTFAKFFLGIVISLVFGAFIKINHTLSDDYGFYMCYLLAYLINAFLPDFYYRGIEKMKVITFRTISIKSFFALSTVVFVKCPEDYWKVPIITLIGNLFAVFVSYIDLWKNYKICMRKSNVKEIGIHIRDTVPFFISRIASTVYQALNTIILSFLYGSSAILGYYTSADKIVSLSKSVASPIADSLYPYMLREKNYQMLKKFLLVVMPIIVALAIVVFCYAEPLCIFLFGKEFGGTGKILRCLLPIMVVILPTYILCFPVMVPMGLSKYANMSNVIGMIIQFMGIVFLYIIGKLNVYTLCILSSIAEVSVFLFRLFWVIRGRDR